MTNNELSNTNSNIDNKTIESIVIDLVEGKLITIRDISNKYNISMLDTINLVSNKKFIRWYTKTIKSIKYIEHLNTSTDVLLRIVRTSESEKSIISASAVLDSITKPDPVQRTAKNDGPSKDVNININLGEVIKSLEAKGEVIDMEEEDDYPGLS